jgi:hypothetical protein
VTDSDAVLRRIERYSLIVCIALAAAAWIATRRGDVLLGVAGGGGLAAISYQGIKSGIDAAAGFGRSSRGAVAIGLVKFFTRYAILAVAAYVIMARLRLPPVAVFAGASSLVIAVMVEALRGARNPHRPG